MATGDFKPVHAALRDDQSSVLQTRPQDTSSKIKAEFESTHDLSDQVHMYYRFYRLIVTWYRSTDYKNSKYSTLSNIIYYEALTGSNDFDIISLMQYDSETVYQDRGTV